MVVVKDSKHIPTMDENFAMFFKTPRQKYTEGVLNHLLIKEEDLTETEKEIITYGFDLLQERLDEMKILNDEIKRLNIELANFKSYNDDKDY
jgi:hypothetical protein